MSASWPMGIVARCLGLLLPTGLSMSMRLHSPCRSPCHARLPGWLGVHDYCVGPIVDTSCFQLQSHIFESLLIAIVGMKECEHSEVRIEVADSRLEVLVVRVKAVDERGAERESIRSSIDHHRI